MPSAAACGRAAASIAVAWPWRRAEGRMSYPMCPPTSNKRLLSRWRMEMRPRKVSPSAHHSMVMGTKPGGGSESQRRSSAR
ncbi:hypothetical protein GCM10028833_22310 [Glycomyces tarimensis]